MVPETERQRSANSATSSQKTLVYALGSKDVGYRDSSYHNSWVKRGDGWFGQELRGSFHLGSFCSLGREYHNSWVKRGEFLWSGLGSRSGGW